MKELQVLKHVRETVKILYNKLKLKNFEKATGRSRILSNQDVISLTVYKHTQGIPTRKQI